MQATNTVRRVLPQFCFTGGYIEAALIFPGDDYISGFWPAFCEWAGFWEGRVRDGLIASCELHLRSWLLLCAFTKTANLRLTQG